LKASGKQDVLSMNTGAICITIRVVVKLGFGKAFAGQDGFGDLSTDETDVPAKTGLGLKALCGHRGRAGCPVYAV
jgi:hypothetical protein